MAQILKKIKGHEKIIERMLSAQSQDRLFPSLIFVGSEGIGKRLTAMGLLQVMICEKKSEKNSACGKCGACLRLEKGESEALLEIQPDGTQIKAEQAREVVNFVSLRSISAARMVIIHQSHMMGPQAANVLLKTLEEPPPNSYFVMLTPNLSALLTTIRSRSQVVRFSPLSSEVIGQITGVHDWRATASGGSLHLWNQLGEGEWSDLRTQALNGLIAAWEEPGTPAFREWKLDKSEALFVIRVWQQVVRDVLILQNGGGQCIHADQMNLLQSWTQLPPDLLLKWQKALAQMESDFFGQIDRQLSFENFAFHFEKDRAKITGDTLSL
jgi:DNA polymerase-3 subunit delta'